MYWGEKISLEKTTLLLAIFCLFFVVIGGVSASDVVDMSNNPDNNNLVSDSSDSLSEESVGNYYTNQLSNEAVSSLSQSADNDDALGISSGGSEVLSNDGGSEVQSANADSSSSNHEVTSSSTASKSTAKASTSLKLSKSKIYSGTPIIITLKDKNGKVLSGKKVKISVPSKKRVFYFDFIKVFL